MRDEKNVVPAMRLQVFPERVADGTARRLSMFSFELHRRVVIVVIPKVLDLLLPDLVLQGIDFSVVDDAVDPAQQSAENAGEDVSRDHPGGARAVTRIIPVEVHIGLRGRVRLGVAKVRPVGQIELRFVDRLSSFPLETIVYRLPPPLLQCCLLGLVG